MDTLWSKCGRCQINQKDTEAIEHCSALRKNFPFQKSVPIYIHTRPPASQARIAVGLPPCHLTLQASKPHLRFGTAAALLFPQPRTQIIFLLSRMLPPLGNTFGFLSCETADIHTRMLCCHHLCHEVETVRGVCWLAGLGF